MPTTLWQPTATQELMQARMRLNQQIRDFFSVRHVLEVETPLLSHTVGTDPNLHPLSCGYQPHPFAAEHLMYLQTSPEFAMKRLLANGSGPIFQLCKAFRNGESGSRHNPEFTMLEWYRPGYSLEQLMAEVEQLVHAIIGTVPCKRVSYRHLFQQYLAVDPHQATATMLAKEAQQHIEISASISSKDELLDLLYSHVIEPKLIDPVFIYDYPASQAALARITTDEQGESVALRFELVVQGMEIANGYDELVDASEQRLRFAADQIVRKQRGLPVYATDERLLQALEHGIEQCAGVALGVDRLLMLATASRSIDEVLAFGHTRA